MSFAAKIAQQRALVYDFRTPVQDVIVYHIFEADPKKHSAFQRAFESEREGLDLRDYGTILHSGIGEPPAELKAELRQKYGMYKDEL